MGCHGLGAKGAVSLWLWFAYAAPTLLFSETRLEAARPSLSGTLAPCWPLGTSPILAVSMRRVAVSLARAAQSLLKWARLGVCHLGHTPP